MSLDLHPDLRCLVMVDGTVFGNIDDADTIRPMEIRQGASMAPFEPCDDSPVSLFEVVEEYRLQTRSLVTQSRSEPSEDIPGNIYACWVNHLPDWTLKGADTIQLMINRHDAPCTVFFDTDLHIPSVEGEMFVEAYLAAHRAQATLCVQMRDLETDEIKVFRTNFDTACAGGVHRNGYAHIRHAIPVHFTRCDITFSVDYQARQHDSAGVEPYLFIADIRAAKLRDTGVADQILEPEWLYGRSPEGRGQWVRAPLPDVLTQGQGIDVTLGDLSIPLTPMRKPDFTVRENYGHTLVCSCSEEMDLVLCIDGQHVEQIKIKQNDTIIRLPNRYLNCRFCGKTTC